MAIDYGFIIGYGSWVAIQLCYSQTNYIYKSSSSGIALSADEDKLIMLQVISGSVTRALSYPSVTTYFTPHSSSSGQAKSIKRTAFGVYSYNGEISFEFSKAALDLFEGADGATQVGQFFKRSTIFHLQFFDGKNTCTMYNCVWDKFTISSSPGSVVTGSISFHSNNAYNQQLMITNSDLKTSYVFDSTDFLIPYWKSGRQGLSQFSIDFNRNVQPVYLNNRLKVPSYMRPGIINASLSLTYYDYYNDSSSAYISALQNVPSFDIYIDTITISFKGPILQSLNYSLSSMSDAGLKTYNWVAIPFDNTNYAFTISTSSSDDEEEGQDEQ